ncbi:MAG: hypothetical protein GY861_15420 [bacterium]|nr:hypothetical protein [bacterium]
MKIKINKNVPAFTPIIVEIKIESESDLDEMISVMGEMSFGYNEYRELKAIRGAKNANS